MKTRNLHGLALNVYAIKYPPTVRVREGETKIQPLRERVTKDPALTQREREREARSSLLMTKASNR